MRFAAIRSLASPSEIWTSLFFLCAVPLFAADANTYSNSSAVYTPVTLENLDPAAFAEWFDGTEHLIEPKDTKDQSRKPQWAVATNKSAPGHSGITYGSSKTPGQRHLRIGFQSPLLVGSVILRGPGQVSVLRPNAKYPGDMNDESQWILAERLVDRQVVRKEADRNRYACWVLPEQVATRSIRFTHVADITDKDYSGWLGGAYVFPSRVMNVAPQAVASASSNDKDIAKLNNEHTDAQWDQWSNIVLRTGDRAEVVSPVSPEWVLLTWPVPVKLSGLGALYAGFANADAQIYVGPNNIHPREAPDNAWQTVASFSGLKNRYPSVMGADWLDFGREVTTRALRLRMTASINDNHHQHVNGHTNQGKRVWIGELVAIHALGTAELNSAILPKVEPEEHAPIPIKFALPEAGFVTLVIDDAAGKRVRNLLADAFFEKGEHTAWWDGSNDLARDTNAAKHGLYYIPTQFVSPGKYQVRGLWRKKIDLTYEFGVYGAGHTPWQTTDKSGGWLANHTPPSAVLFVPDGGHGEPAVLIGSYVSEGGAGLAWVDLQGRKWKGQNWVGGNWTGAPYIARDNGPNPVSGIYAYVGAAWTASTSNKDKSVGEIRLTGLTAKEDLPIVKHSFIPKQPAEGDVKWEKQIGGLAAHNGLLGVSMTAMDRLLFVNATSGNVLGEHAVESPRGLAFDSEGLFYVLSGNVLLRYRLGELTKETKSLPMPNILIKKGLEDPAGLAIDSNGNIYISDRGLSHQVKVFNKEGKPLRVVGRPGAPQAGPYDSLHLNNPRGLTIDSLGRLWVAEEDSQPKRVSCWNADGLLVRAFYGPTDYGGGGVIDPQDKTRFYYHGMEFRLDWEKGTDQLASVFYRTGDTNQLPLAFRAGVPETPIYLQGRRYFTNCFNSSPTGGHGTAYIFLEKKGVAVPIAAAGRANDWELLKSPEFTKIWPEKTDPHSSSHTNKAAFFLWSDHNGDTRVQPEEVQMRRAQSGGVTVARDLSFVISRLDGQATRFAPSLIGVHGVPKYEIASSHVLAEAGNPPSSGGDQVLLAPQQWTIHTTAPKPFRGEGVGGALNGIPMWTYPSLWPGLHASHSAPVVEQPGVVVGHTRLLGDLISPTPNEPLWVLNGNHGTMYVFTVDGLFVAQLFQEMRVGRQWAMPVAKRGMSLNDVTPSDENFWPSISQTSDGNVYLVAGRPNCIVRVDGLNTIRRLPNFSLEVTPDDLNLAREFFVKAEAARQASQGRGVLTVAVRATSPTVDGKLDDWSTATWVDIDKRGSAAYFNADTKPYNVTGAVAVSGDRIYAAWRTGDADLLKNAGDVPYTLFKTGGALDLMIAADPTADPKRSKPAIGDQRLLVALVGGKPRALLYRAVVPGALQPVPFASPWRTMTFDRVEDVTDQLQIGSNGGDFEISLPQKTLGLKVKVGTTLIGDIGVLRGNGSVTTQRVYWSNKSSAIVADVPSEAELRPSLWGRWEFLGK